MWFLTIVAVSALFAALFLVWVSRRHRFEISSVDDLASTTRPVDVEAFRNLVDPDETEFLRRRLNAPDFRRIQRERNLAAAEYVGNISHNARILIRLGQTARFAQETDVQRAASDMLQTAVAVRMLAMRVLVLLYIDSAFPSFQTSNIEILQRYRELTNCATMFTRLQRPAFAGRVSALL